MPDKNSEIIKLLLNELERVKKETSNHDWDCYQALPINNEGYVNTKYFINKYLLLQIADIGVAPDGHVSLDFPNITIAFFDDKVYYASDSDTTPLRKGSFIFDSQYASNMLKTLVYIANSEI